MPDARSSAVTRSSRIARSDAAPSRASTSRASAVRASTVRCALAPGLGERPDDQADDGADDESDQQPGGHRMTPEGGAAATVFPGGRGWASRPTDRSTATNRGCRVMRAQRTGGV